MLETLDAQFTSGKSLASSRHRHFLSPERWPKWTQELYPVAEAYYHELNPSFGHWYQRPDLLGFTSCLTLRDGQVSLADFFLRNLRHLEAAGTGLLIHPSLAPLVPTSLRNQCWSWLLTQEKRRPLEQCHGAILFGLLCEPYVGDPLTLNHRLSVLSNLPPGAEIELYLPIKSDPFQRGWRETPYPLQVMTAIREALPGRKFRYHTSAEFLKKADLGGLYFMDLQEGVTVVADNFMQYFAAARGATVHGWSGQRPAAALRSFPLSFHHDFHVLTLPETKSCFQDLAYEWKLAGSGDPIFERGLHRLLKRALAAGS